MVCEAVKFCALEYKTCQSKAGSQGLWEILNLVRTGGFLVEKKNLAENSDSPELFQECSQSLFLAGAWAAGGRGRGGTRRPGQALPAGVGERGWARLEIPWPNNAEQQSATGSGDLKHVTFVPQVSCPRRVGGGRAAPAAGAQLTDGGGAAWPGLACPACPARPDPTRPGPAGHPTSAGSEQPPAVGTNLRPGSCCLRQGGTLAAEREGKRKAEPGGVACSQPLAKKKNHKKENQLPQTLRNISIFPK